MSLVFESNLLAAAVALLLGATVVRLWAYSNAQRGRDPTFGMMLVVVFLLGLAVCGRWARENQGPFLTLYDILLSNAFSLTLLFLIVVWRMPVVRPASILAYPILLLITAWASVMPPEAVPLPATFDNPWLWVHVLSGKLFLGVLLPAACLAGLLVVRTGRARRGIGLATDPAASDRAIWLLFFLAFVFHSCMLVSGSVWAYGAWGRYWSWDTLETSTLITWLTMGGVLHARVTFRQASGLPAYWMVVAIFVMAFLTFFGVPLLSIAPHKGFM